MSGFHDFDDYHGDDKVIIVNEEQIKSQAPTAADWSEAAAVSQPQSIEDTTHLTVENFDDHDTRKFWAKIQGSAKDIAKGIISTTWRAPPGKEHIYQRIVGYDGDKPIYEGDLTKGIMLDAMIGFVKNTYHFDIGVTIDGVQGEEVADDGKFYACIIPARTMQPVKLDQPCFTPHAKNKITARVLEEHRDTNVKHLEASIFRQNNNDVYCLVDNLSVVADMLRLNKKKLGLHIDLRSDIPGYLKAPSDLVDACLKKYSDSQRVNFLDMPKFGIHFHRVGGLAWDDPAGIIDNVDPRNPRANKINDKRFTNNYEVLCQVGTKLVLFGK
jgi:hypothetical protein